MRRSAAIVILVISLFITGLAVAVPFEDATKAYDQGDYENAYRIIKPLADQGYTEVQHKLGVLYEEGQGVPQDYAEAAKWYRKAADQGDAFAQYNLGVMYATGDGVPQEYVLAHIGRYIFGLQE